MAWKPREIDVDAVRKVFTYDPATGVIKYRKRHGRIRPDLVAGSVHVNKKGPALKIFWNGGAVSAGRMAWALHYGECPMPPFCVSYRDHDQTNIRIDNLLLTTVPESQMLKRAKKGTYAELKGVSFHIGNNCWEAKIKVGPRRINLGSHYRTPEAAHAAYVKAARKHFGQFACSGSWESANA